MVKLRHTRVLSRKPSLPSSRTLIFTLFVTFSFLILFLLTLRIPKPIHINSVSHNQLRNDDNPNERWVEIVSWMPRVFIYHNFLTKEECEHLINIAKPYMYMSMVVDEETGKIVNSSERTSSGTFLDGGSDNVLRNIEKRISDYTFIPIENGESVNILHYEVGQKFDAHFDYYPDSYHIKNGGQRIATMLIYLSDVEEGGETVFPNAKGDITSVSWWNELSDCGKTGLSIKPKMGNALLFWSMKPDGTTDPTSLHGACPVIKGNKWSCTKWLWNQELRA